MTAVRRLREDRWRTIVTGLITATTAVAAGLLGRLLGADGFLPLGLLLMSLFVILFAWISAAFYTAAVGFVVCLVRPRRPEIELDRSHVSEVRRDRDCCRTAIVMPIYNEDPTRVFAGIRAVYRSLVETGRVVQFHFFILSDSSDPEIWPKEEQGWRRLVRDLEAGGRIFYRRRTRNEGRKSGNVADFCERWGRKYEYMIVLDADSIIAGDTVCEMVRRMDREPGVGILQVPTLPVNRESLFARVQQFAARVYGPLFAAGLGFWQRGEGTYWGHNAIIRLEPFIAHCGLPTLPGSEPFGGEILSHDFVEAALMRRAGWEVRLADDLGGSYEECPSTLIDYVRRDRRWCQGNLQHLPLLFARGFHPTNRVNFAMGAMCYLSAPLWFLFVLVGSFEAIRRCQLQPCSGFGDFLSYPVEVTTLLVLTLGMLYLPKVFGLVLLFRQPDTLKASGGAIRAALSVTLESLFLVFVAPILMVFHTRFVAAILSGRSVPWIAQQREDMQTGLAEAWYTHARQTLFGLTCAAVVYVLVPELLAWLTLALVGLVFSIPLSVGSSRVDWGSAAKRIGVFVTPEETQPPRVLKLLRADLEPQHRSSRPQDADPPSPLAPVLPSPHIPTALRTADHRKTSGSPGFADDPVASSMITADHARTL